MSPPRRKRPTQGRSVNSRGRSASIQAMPPTATPSSLIAIPGAVIGSSCPLPRPERSLARGLVAPTRRTLQDWVSSNFRNATFCEARSALADDVAMLLRVLDSDPGILQLCAIDGEPLDIVGSVSEDNALADPDDPGTVFVDARTASVAVVHAAEKTGLLINAAAGCMSQVFLPLQPQRVRPIESPVLQWCRDSGDRALERWTLELLGEGDAIAHVVAAGRYKRLSSQARNASHQVDALLRGETDEAFAAPHRWFRSLSPGQRREVERIASNRARLLLDRISERPPEERDALEREDLEGVRALLVEAGAGARLSAHLAEVDRKGLLHARGRRSPSHPRLARAWVVDPQAWWLDLEEAPR